MVIVNTEKLGPLRKAVRVSSHSLYCNLPLNMMQNVEDAMHRVAIALSMNTTNS